MKRGSLVGLAILLAAGDARAVDLPKAFGAPVKLDVTETSIVAQRFSARAGEQSENQGYFAWLNRLNLVLGWNKFTLGARIDSSYYALRPEDNRDNPDRRQLLVTDGSTRYRDAIYPAKLWLSYKNAGVEVTAGDSYVQFGRGLTLSVRKVDELGIDTTIFGGKVTVQKDPFGVTLVAGLANPARVDEPTGRALFPSKTIPELGGFAPTPPQPLFGSDRIVGAEISAGRGLPVILSTRLVRMTKCAPYRYDANGNIDTNLLDRPIGTCNETDREAWLDDLPSTIGPVIAARNTTNIGQSIEVPSFWGHGNFYLEGAFQRREPERVRAAHIDGNALYASLVNTGGPIANTLEVKSYRNYYPLAGSVNVTRAAAFSNIAYSIPPTAEPIIADSMFGNYNVCVNSARDRFDYRFTPTFLAYGAYAYSVSKSEIFGGECDRWGKSTGQPAVNTTNFIHDGTLGVEARFDDDKSALFANVVARHDVIDNGTPYYRELAAQYSFTKYIKGPYSVEFAGRHRYRVQDGENIRGPTKGEPWWQGEHQTVLKVAPKWVVSQGVEYTTLVGLPTYYINGSVLYRFTSESNIRLYAGQNRGGLRCISGICRIFPAFSGVRAELTLRF
ncbi:MAG: hypothetical protein KIT84_11685 [Labilithrix sp.]|nr:hypothetical protein [Labilithrix sp.]MCW5811671.1 hypothetical protein [Labilithrix sp.]